MLPKRKSLTVAAKVVDPSYRLPAPVCVLSIQAFLQLGAWEQPVWSARSKFEHMMLKLDPSQAPVPVVKRKQDADDGEGEDEDGEDDDEEDEEEDG